VIFDNRVILDDLVDGLAERFYVCSMINEKDVHNTIHPHAVHLDGGTTLRLEFDFSKALIPASDRCYNLKCSTNHTKKGVEMIQPVQLKTKYCFMNQDEMDKDPLSHCNPFAWPKLDSHGACLCAAPYTGPHCEECLEGFKAVKKVSTTKAGKEHTSCAIDNMHLTDAVCNSHGTPKSRDVSRLEDVECDCREGYGGAFCDFCTDPTFAYPDC